MNKDVNITNTVIIQPFASDVVALVYTGLGSDDEVRLVETLFNSHGYNPLIRPVVNLSEIVTIKFGLAMIQLINVVCVEIVFVFKRGNFIYIEGCTNKKRFEPFCGLMRKLVALAQ